jgi:hypothetical protein
VKTLISNFKLLIEKRKLTKETKDCEETKDLKA